MHRPARIQGHERNRSGPGVHGLIDLDPGADRTAAAPCRRGGGSINSLPGRHCKLQVHYGHTYSTVHSCVRKLARKRSRRKSV